MSDMPDTKIFEPLSEVDKYENLANEARFTADKLAAEYTTLAGLEATITRQELALSEHLAAQIPPDGWPGSNAERRKAAEEQARLEDQVARKLNRELLSLKEQRDRASASLRGLQAYQRAVEYSITALLVQALAGKIAYASKRVAAQVASEVALKEDVLDTLREEIGDDR